MKFKFLGILGSLLLSIGCFAQNTTVTATVVDGDSVAWANATWTIDFVPSTQFPTPSQYTVNGAPLSSSVTHQTGSLDNSGALSVVVYDSSLTAPIGSSWRISLCPQTSGSCSTYQFSTAGGSQNISTNLTTTIGQPRFACATVCHGYNTIQALPATGAFFYNTTPATATTCFQYSGASWLSCATGSGSTVTAIQTINIVGSSTTTITFSAIPQTFKHLLLVGNGRVNTGGAAANLTFNFNGDGGSNYDWAKLQGGVTVATQGSSQAGTAILVTSFAETSTSANQTGSFMMHILSYSGTTFNKTTFTNSILPQSATAGTFDAADWAGQWRSTAAITSITITGGGGNFVAGTVFSLYGYN